MLPIFIAQLWRQHLCSSALACHRKVRRGEAICGLGSSMRRGKDCLRRRWCLVWPHVCAICLLPNPKVLHVILSRGMGSTDAGCQTPNIGKEKTIGIPQVMLPLSSVSRLTFVGDIRQERYVLQVAGGGWGSGLGFVAQRCAGQHRAEATASSADGLSAFEPTFGGATAVQQCVRPRQIARRRIQRSSPKHHHREPPVMSQPPAEAPPAAGRGQLTACCWPPATEAYYCRRAVAAQ